MIAFVRYMDYKKIENLITDRLLESALNEIGKNASDRYNGELDNIRITYEYMKSYMLSNTSDSAREDLYCRLLCQAHELLDKVYIDSELEGNSSLFFQKLRYYRGQGNRSLASIVNELEGYAENMALSRLLDNGKYSLDENLKHERNLQDMFYLVWTNISWSNTDAEDMKKLFDSQLVTVADKALAVSAVFQSLLVAFDLKKYMLLINLCSHENNEVAGRASVALLAVSRTHDRIINLYREAKDAINVMSDNASLKDNLCTVAIQFLKTMDTKQIDRKFREEIIPELMKKQSEMKDKLGSDIIDDKTFNEINPEWQEEFDKSGLGEKIKEIGELQQEGFDVYMGTFESLKGFPFFYEMCNWFYPFDKENSYLNKTVHGINKSNDSFLGAILDSKSLCNSDKYSFCFMLSQVPESQRGMLTAQIGGDMAQLKDAVREEAKTVSASNVFIQDLYRFYNLSRDRHGLKNIFENLQDIVEVKCLGRLIDNQTTNLSIAEFLFRKEHYAMSYRYFKKYLADGNCTNNLVYQKAGYNAQRIGRFEEAIEHYTKADSISPNNVWVISHLAYCYTMVADYEKAIEYYKLAELLDPANLKVTMQKCKCLILCKEYEAATEYLFRIYFEHPDNIPVMRMMAWCYIENGAKEDALKFYDKIRETGTEMSANDLANLGHVLWINGKAGEALEAYKSSCKAKDKAAFLKTMADDTALLVRYGITETDIAIMKDIVLNQK